MDEESLLVRHILAGDDRAWHRFVETHETFLKRVLHHYVQDDELLGNLFVTLLEKLKKNKLRRFSGRSSLRTWLFIVAKNHCRDYFRSKSGVRHVLSALEELERIDRRFFRLFYMERMPLRDVHSSLGLEFGDTLSYVDLLECDERIRKRLDEKKLGNIPDKLLNPQILTMVPLDSIQGRTISRPVDGSSASPDFILDSMELERAIQNLNRVILNLPSKDQILLKLRFEHKLSARRISEVLDLANEKQVYRRLKRLLAQLEKMLGDTGLAPETYAELAVNIETLSCYRDRRADIDGVH
jgi:DNA-directed RNA polymerase specialized sigma24 family protein